VYIFTPKETVEKNKSQSNKTAVLLPGVETDKTAILLPGLGLVISSDLMKTFSKEIAVSTYDNNTLVIGSPLRVRETFQTKMRVDAEVLSLVNQKPNALMSFALRMPGGMSSLIDLGNDELGKNIDSIRRISGVLDVNEGNAIVSLVAKTIKPEQAQALKETLDGLQMVGKAFLGGGKGADKKVFARMIENARITNNGSEVMLDLQVPQSDIDILVGVK
ncbi:MAG: hypothetical protein ABR566_07465, partial [Pyrinomonadaceae bacterium]